MTTRLRRTHLAALTLAAVVAAPIIATNAGASPDAVAVPATETCSTATTNLAGDHVCPTTTTWLYIPPIPTTTSTSTTTTTAPPLDPSKPAAPECDGLPDTRLPGVPTYSAHYETMACAWRLGLLPIQPSGVFAPSLVVDRLDFAETMIHMLDVIDERPAGAPVPTTTTTTAPTTTTTVAPPVFSDLPDGMTANEKFQALIAAGIFQGTPEGTFDPDGQITRAQMAAVIARLMGSLGVVQPPAPPNPFADVTGWAAGYIAAASHAGLIQGFGTGTFNPGGQVSVGQLATVTIRFLAIPGL